MNMDILKDRNWFSSDQVLFEVENLFKRSLQGRKVIEVYYCRNSQYANYKPAIVVKTQKITEAENSDRKKKSSHNIFYKEDYHDLDALLKSVQYDINCYKLNHFFKQSEDQKIKKLQVVDYAYPINVFSLSSKCDTEEMSKIIPIGITRLINNNIYDPQTNQFNVDNIETLVSLYEEQEKHIAELTKAICKRFQEFKPGILLTALNTIIPDIPWSDLTNGDNLIDSCSEDIIRLTLTPYIKCYEKLLTCCFSKEPDQESNKFDITLSKELTLKILQYNFNDQAITTALDIFKKNYPNSYANSQELIPNTNKNIGVLFIN